MCHNSILRWLGRTGVLVLLLLFTCQLANGQGRLYWTEPANLTIMSSNFDGSSQLTEGRGQALDKVIDVDIDQETGWLYWTKYYFYSGAAIARSSPDGREGGIITRDVADPNGIALDGVNGYIYWTEDSRVRRSNLDGIGTVDLVDGIEWPVALKISIDNQLMFWTGPAGTYRSMLDGAEIRRISNVGGDRIGVDPARKSLYVAIGKAIVRMDFEGTSVDTVVTSAFKIHALAVEPTAERLCWVEEGPAQYPEPYGPQQLMCSATDGSNVGKIVDQPGLITGLAINRRSRMIYMIDQRAKLLRCKYDGTELENLTHPIFFPVDVAVDPFARRIYSVDGGIFPGAPLTRTDFGGANYKEIEIIGRWGLPSPGDLTTVAVDPENKRLYVGTTGSCSETYGTIIMGSTDGPLDNDIGAGSCVPVRDIELDLNDSKLYYTQDGRVWRRNLDGSAQVQLLSAVGSGIALSDRYLYWLDGPTHSIRRGNLDGTEPVDLLTGVESIRDLAVDASDRYLFWSTPGENTIKRLEIGQSTVHEIVTADVSIGGLYVVSTPSNVTQIAPLNGAADLPTSVSLMWSRPPDAQRFDVQVASGEDIKSVIFASNTPHMEETFVAPLAESTYYWRVRSTGAGGDGPFTAYQKFSVGGSGPLAATLLEPDEGETGVAIQPTFRWTKASEAVYHQIQVADNSSFASPLVGVDSLTDDYFSGVSLAHEATYYWRVAGIAADGKYTFTAPRSFATVVAAPQAVTLLSPPDEASDLPTTLPLSWSRPAGADRFDVQVASDQNIDNVIFSSNTPNTEEIFVAPFAASSYYWWVRSTGAGGNGPFTASAKFTVGESGPLAATLLEPDQGEAGVVTEPTFRWMKAPDAVYHRLQVAENDSFATPLIDLDSLSTDSLAALLPDHDKTYYWRVAGIADDGKYTFTAPRSFTTVVAPPQAITLLSPDASTDGVPAYATFTWQSPGDADSYHLEIASDSLFGQILVDVETPATVYALETPLSYDTRYFWRVCGLNEGGEGAWSEYRAFRTVVGTGITADGLPAVFALNQNFPNPFSHSTQVSYDLPRSEHVSLVVFDALGRQVERLVDGMAPAGTHTVTFRATEQPGGVYVCRMRAGAFEKVMGMVVAR